MDDTSNNVIDVPQSKVEKAKALVKKYETPLACAATGVVSFALGRKIHNSRLSEAITGMNQAMAHLEEAFDGTAGALGVAMDFIDSKNLTKQYTKFHNEAVGNLA